MLDLQHVVDSHPRQPCTTFLRRCTAGWWHTSLFFRLNSWLLQGDVTCSILWLPDWSHFVLTAAPSSILQAALLTYSSSHWHRNNRLLRSGVSSSTGCTNRSKTQALQWGPWHSWNLSLGFFCFSVCLWLFTIVQLLSFCSPIPFCIQFTYEQIVHTEVLFWANCVRPLQDTNKYIKKHITQ